MSGYVIWYRWRHMNYTRWVSAGSISKGTDDTEAAFTTHTRGEAQERADQVKKNVGNDPLLSVGVIPLYAAMYQNLECRLIGQNIAIPKIKTREKEPE